MSPTIEPNTYLHAGSGKRGWPHDHSVDDTYEVPPFTWTEPKPLDVDVCEQSGLREKAIAAGMAYSVPHVTEDCNALKPGWLAEDVMRAGDQVHAWAHQLVINEEREYRAECGPSGEALLVLEKSVAIAKFDTFADAELAAKALNEHKGY